MQASDHIVQNAMAILGLNQKEMAKRLEKSQSTISKYTGGSVTPPADVIIQCMNIIENHEVSNSSKIESIIEKLTKAKASGQFLQSIKTLIDEHIKVLKEKHE